MNKEDRVFQLATQLFLKKPLPPYIHDKNEKEFRSAARDVFEIAKAFVDEYDKLGTPDSPPDEL